MTLERGLRGKEQRPALGSEQTGHPSSGVLHAEMNLLVWLEAVWE